MTEITDINDSRIEDYRALRFTPAGHTENKIFVAEGEKLIQKILESDLEIISIFGCKKYLDKYFPIIENKVEKSKVYISEKDLVNRIAGYKLHQGIMAIASQPVNADLNMLSDRIVILNRLINAENIGAIIRNAAAFGFDSLICDEYTCHPYMRRSVRVSMGSIFYEKIRISESIINDIEYLRDRQYKIIAAETGENAQSLYTIGQYDKIALVLGSENNGIDQELLNMSDIICQIPISTVIESINVAASGAIIMSYFNQQ